MEKTFERVSVGPILREYINKVACSFLIEKGSPKNAIYEATDMALSDIPKLQP